jgi:hypothetical protein
MTAHPQAIMDRAGTQGELSCHTGAKSRYMMANRRVPRMIVEMRTYKLKPGTRAPFLEAFRTKSIPEHLKLGMKISGPLLSVEDPDVFFFMRGFPDLASREPLKAKFYDGDLWKGELESVLMPMIERYDVVVVSVPENELSWRLDGRRGAAAPDLGYQEP